MSLQKRLARIESELNQEWERYSEEIGIVYNDLANEVDGQRKHILRRKLKNLETERASVGEKLNQIEQGLYRFPEDVLADNLSSLRQRMLQEAASRSIMQQRIVNHRPPIILQNFKNRLRELFELRRHLFNDNISLISVVGQAGIGKTALVCKLLSELEKGKLVYGEEEREIDGIIYLDTRTGDLSLEQIYSSVVQLLEEPTAQGLRDYWSNNSKASIEDRSTFLLSMLQDGVYILSVDNFETCLNDNLQIVEAGLLGFLQTALITEHGLHIVITSRESFDLSPILSQRTRRVWIRDGLPDKDAIEYLRALDPNGDFDLKNASDEWLTQAAHKVYGIPRALESIASLLASDLNLTLTSLLENERLFSGHVISNLMNESYRKLRNQEREALVALSIYNRPVEFAAIAFILNTFYPDMDVADSLRWLVYRHFVTFDRSSHVYAIHPIIRQFVYGQMAEDDLLAYEREAAGFYRTIRSEKEEWKNIEDLDPQLLEFEHLINAKDYKGAAELLGEIESQYLRPWGHYRQTIRMRHKLTGNLSDTRLVSRQPYFDG